MTLAIAKCRSSQVSLKSPMIVMVLINEVKKMGLMQKGMKDDQVAARKTI